MTHTEMTTNMTKTLTEGLKALPFTRRQAHVSGLSMPAEGVEVISGPEWTGICGNGLGGWRISVAEVRQVPQTAAEAAINGGGAYEYRRIEGIIPLEELNLEEVKALLGGEWYQQFGTWYQKSL